MDLFEQLSGEPANLLPHDGTLLYYGRVMSQAQADDYLQRLTAEVPWLHDEVNLMGKRIVTRRKYSWHGDKNWSYEYSGAVKTARPWVPVLRELKALVEEASGCHYNSCLLNLYHDGSEGMSWHTDNEKELQPQAAITSVSFGAERRFLLRHKGTKQTLEKYLEHGSLLVLKDEIQQHWLHSVPNMAAVKTPRISLTFRSMRDDG